MPTAARKSRLQERPEIRAVLAVNVIAMRGAKGWSQDALALECGLHRTFIAHVERRARNVSLESLEKIAVALQVPTFQLLVPPAVDGV